MSYTIDIYYGKLKPTRKFLDFALFVAFFPQLVAGPIERARHLLPQIINPRRPQLQHFYEGCYLIFWGIFQKVFVADNLAKAVDPVFAGDIEVTGMHVLVAMYAFAFQIFCDFAGYSNIARGLAKCMGFDIMVNFRMPYFATNPTDFWRRWHISLSTWLRDYLYIPLGGNRRGSGTTLRNLAITMLLGGLWHGAAWTFVFWGGYHALLLIVHRVCAPVLQQFKLPAGSWAERIWFAVRVICFFHLVCLGWLIFRSQSFTQLSGMLQILFTGWSGISIPALLGTLAQLIPYLWILLLVQIVQYMTNDLLIVLKMNVWTRSIFYYICSISIVIFGVTGAKEFIYFQF